MIDWLTRRAIAVSRDRLVGQNRPPTLTHCPRRSALCSVHVNLNRIFKEMKIIKIYDTKTTLNELISPPRPCRSDIFS
jgi:hypothetical protein